MRVRRVVAIALLALGGFAARASGAPPATTATTTAAAVGPPPFPADHLTITAAASKVWTQGSLGVAEAHGSVHIELGAARLTADDAVVWLRPARGDGTTPVDIVLVGHAEATVDKLTVVRDRYWIAAEVTGPVRLVGPRVNRVDDQSPTYRAATDLLRQQRPTAAAATRRASAAAAPPATGPAEVVALPTAIPPAAAVPAVATKSLSFDFARQDVQRTADGDIALVLTGGASVTYRSATGDLLEFSAASVVLFTDLHSTREAQGGGGGVADHVTAGYFEGDVRVYTTPFNGSRNELRMRAERMYYEFATDRAVMDQVVFHTVDARKGIPVFMRAAAVRQLSQGEFKGEDVKLTTSAFATPTYGLSAAHIYVRSEDSGDPRVGERVAYAADNVTLDAFGVPFIYVPAASGTMTARGSIFRGISVEDGNQFGVGVRTDWGLFETLGVIPPEHVDASYRLDYYSDRGPAGGIDTTYYGNGTAEGSHDPYNLAGDLHAYFVDDHGTDVLGAARQNEPAPEAFRGRVRYEHEQDLGDDLTVQVRGSWDSDSNFLPQYFRGEYENGLPLDESAYVKRQHGSELASLGVEFQPNRVVSTADDEQENRERSRLPDLHYDRVGDSLLGDRLTFFSDDSAAGDKFVRSTQSLAQQGFVNVADVYRSVQGFPDQFGSPGRAAFAYTGDPGSTTYVGDARQEVDFPIHLGLLNVVPYAVGRYTVYSQGVDAFRATVTPNPKDPNPKLQPSSDVRGVPNRVAVGADQNRLLGGAGVRVTTDVWRVDDAVQSDLFDLHRIRHVVSPELTVFASGQTVDQNRLFIYDPSRDAVNDVQAMQVALRQRWQTKRGGPGRWRSSDVFSLDLFANLYANQPAARFRDPADFRSVFLQAEPEYSQPRNTANAEATWRLSDTTAVLGGVVHNLDEQKLATANIGIAVTRGDRLSYFVGTRYIADLNSDVATFEASYQLDRKYSLGASESVDLAQSRNVYYTATLTRQFETFSVSVNAHYDQSTNDEGFGFSLSPNGLARGVGTSQLQQLQQQ